VPARTKTRAFKSIRCVFEKYWCNVNRLFEIGSRRSSGKAKLWSNVILIYMARKTCLVMRLGKLDYVQAWRLQETLAQEIASGAHLPSLLLLEHPHTYTFGRRGKSEHLIYDAAEIARREIEVHWVDRGGDITYHGPGQLVGYPLLPLAVGGLMPRAGEEPRLPQADYVGYIRKLEQALIMALAELGVTGYQQQGLTGVWVEHPRDAGEARGLAKIAAIGVKVDARGVSRHGFALNISTDQDYWDGIIGCGLKDHSIANLADLINPPPTQEKVMHTVITAFGRVFDFEMVNSS
jgi:lipoyl(octanoyl) transferase